MKTSPIQTANPPLMKRTSFKEPMTLRLISQFAFETILPDKDIALQSMDYLDDEISSEDDAIEATDKIKTLFEQKYGSNIIIVSERSTASFIDISVNQ